MDPLLIIRPPGGDWALNTLIASRVQMNNPVRLTSMTLWNAASDNSSIGVGLWKVPAFYTERNLMTTVKISVYI